MPLLALACMVAIRSQIDLVPSDDIWVYEHASDPAHDANLRIWGSGGKAAPASADDSGDLSMAYLRWDVSPVPAGRQLVGAKLVLKNVENPAFGVEQAKQSPLEARPLAPSFDEATWSYDALAKLLPPAGAKDIYGLGTVNKIDKDQPVTIEIDLLKGPRSFAKALAEAESTPDHHLAIALTSSIDMAGLGRAFLYKVYSREAKEDGLRPHLILDLQ